MAAAATTGVLSTPDDQALRIVFDNNTDGSWTVITIEGKDRSDLLMGLTGALASAGVEVHSAAIHSGLCTAVLNYIELLHSGAYAGQGM